MLTRCNIGTGGVGACFLSQLAYLAKQRSSAHLKLCYISMIDRAYYTKDYTGIDIDNALTELATYGQRPPTIQRIVNHLGNAPSPVILVDNTSAQSLADAYPLFLQKGVSIVTPNKKAFSGSYKLWQDIFTAAQTSNAHVYHESSVGAGLPVICTLKSLVASGDEVTRIEGVFSGTLSFLFNSFSPVDSNMTSGRWSAVVRKAKNLGYTEPDPRDDLNGLDVARKLTILARLSGLPVESPFSFPVESLIPQELENARSADEFLEKLPQFDDQMEERKTSAQKAGKVLRFIGTVDISSRKLKVALEEVDLSHAAAKLGGSDNVISFHTKRYPRPLIVQGAGAGGDVTAMGVSGDLLRVLFQLK